MQARYIPVAVVLLSSVLLLGGCGGSAHPVVSISPVTPTSPSPFVISPSSATVVSGKTVEFTASRAAIWRIQEPGGGTIVSESADKAVYTPSSTGGVYHIIAQAADSSGVVANASAIVVPLLLAPAGTLKSARLAHTATLLTNATIFVAGGGDGPDMIDGFSSIDNAELFNAAAGTVQPAGTVPRFEHTATLLADGTVLIVGGEGFWSGNPPRPEVSNTASLYDPPTGKFTTVGTMLSSRQDHTATLLSDGRVLIAGGDAWMGGISPVALTTAEIYDPTTRTFTRTGDMQVARAFHTATLLPDGKVLIVGGDTEYTSDSRLAACCRAELYDPSTGTFSRTGNTTSLRIFHSATLLQDGRVLLTGGSQENAGAEIYDPNSGVFSRTGSMMFARSFHTATLLPSGKVLIAGGLRWHGGDIDLIEIYDPATSAFTPAASMQQGRFWHTATLMPDGGVIFVGGSSSTDGTYVHVLGSIEKYP